MPWTIADREKQKRKLENRSTLNALHTHIPSIGAHGGQRAGPSVLINEMICSPVSKYTRDTTPPFYRFFTTLSRDRVIVVLCCFFKRAQLIGDAICPRVSVLKNLSVRWRRCSPADVAIAHDGFLNFVLAANLKHFVMVFGF